jgi:hypothetical protein
LIEAAMKSNTRVSSTSWVSSEGVLRKSDRFSSDVSVRDIQLKHDAYASSAEDRVQADISRVSDDASNECEAPMTKKHIRQVMLLDIATGEQIEASARYRAQQIKNLVTERVMEAAGSSSYWRVVPAALYTRAYEHAIYSHDEDQLKWVMRIKVNAAPQSYSVNTTSTFQIDVQVYKQARTQAWWSASKAIYSPIEVRRVGMNQVTQDTVEDVNQAVADIMDSLNHRLACQSPNFKVVQSGEQWTVEAGELAGLHVGDRLVLADAKVLPEHALEQGALDESLLAEVKSVNAYQAQLKPIAGRSKNKHNEWVAWPYTY